MLSKKNNRPKKRSASEQRAYDEENGESLVEEKFGEQNFRVLGEMREKILYIDPTILQFWVEMG